MYSEEIRYVHGDIPYSALSRELNKRPYIGRKMLNGCTFAAGLTCLIMAIFIKCHWNVDKAQQILKYGKWVAIGSGSITLLNECKYFKEGYDIVTKLCSESGKLHWKQKLGLVMYHDYCPIELTGAPKTR